MKEVQNVSDGKHILQNVTDMGVPGGGEKKGVGVEDELKEFKMSKD